MLAAPLLQQRKGNLETTEHFLGLADFGRQFRAISCPAGAGGGSGLPLMVAGTQRNASDSGNPANRPDESRALRIGPKQRAYRQILINQGPVDTIAGRREFRSTSFYQGCAGQSRGTLFPRNRHRPAFQNQNERLGSSLNCLCQNRLGLTLHDPLQNAPAKQQRSDRNAQR